MHAKALYAEKSIIHIYLEKYENKKRCFHEQRNNGFNEINKCILLLKLLMYICDGILIFFIYL